MMNEFQRRILAEAAKFGGKNVTTAEKIVNKLSEAPAIAPGAVTGMFGYSKQQFEMKMRQLIQKMGFEKGINKMEVGDKKMVLHFANAAKARDFVITFNGLTKRQSKGSAASVSTSFDKAKAPAGTNAVVTVDFSMLKTEGLENPSHLFVVLEFLHEQYIAEGGVKAAIEDFMYSFPKEMIADLKKVIKLDVVNTTEAIKRKNKIEVIRKKYKIPASVLGTPSWKMIVDYFDTFHGESVEEQGETVEEGVRMMAGVEKMLKDEGHPSMVSSLRKIKKSLEGKPTGSVLVVTKEKSPESVSIKVYEPSDFASLTKGLTKKPEAKVGSKGSWSGGEVTVVAIKEEVEVAEQFKAGDKVKVPHKGKMVSGKIVRYDDGGTDKARQHGGGYVVDVGEPASVLVPKQKVQKEEAEIEEAKVKYLTGPGKKDSKRIIGIYTMSGKWVKDMNSEREAAAFVNKSWGESVEEEEDMIGEDNWGGGFETSREAQAKVQAGLRADAKKRQMLIISALQKVIDGQMSKVAFKKLTGSSYADIMSLPFYSKKVKMKKEEVENFDEAYAPLDTPNIIGAFTEASKKKRFEYRKSTDKWGLIHGLPHEVCVRESSPSEWRAAKVKGTVCYIATDEGEDGRPVLEKWAIRNHVKYVKAEETDQEGEVIEEQDRAAVQGSKMVYVGQRLRALQSKSMMSGSVVKGETYKVATNKDGKVDLVHQSIGYRTAVRNVDATTIEALIKNRVLS
jgi:hypothetical protein